MSQFPHDEFAKGLLESLLAPFGKVEAAYTLSSETREIDVYFQPDTIPTNLGLLSRFAAADALDSDSNFSCPQTRRFWCHIGSRRMVYRSIFGTNTLQNGNHCDPQVTSNRL
jgi:hypothetical protein